jgi:hypothetical protein
MAPESIYTMAINQNGCWIIRSMVGRAVFVPGKSGFLEVIRT